MRLVSLNTWKGDGAYATRLAAMTEALAGLRPDVVLLQEVLDAPALGLHTGNTIAAHLGCHVANLALREKPRTIDGIRADSRSGLAVLSRFPIRSTLSIPLPDHADDGERAALVVEIDAPAGPLTVTNLHLTHLAQNDLRQRQLAAAQQVTKRPGTALIGGDFNAPIESFALNATGWRDCRSELGQPPQSTLTGRPDGPCIDHLLWAGRGRPPKTWRVDLDQLTEDGQPAISDHCAVVVDLAD